MLSCFHELSHKLYKGAMFLKVAHNMIVTDILLHVNKIKMSLNTLSSSHVTMTSKINKSFLEIVIFYGFKARKVKEVSTMRKNTRI